MTTPKWDFRKSVDEDGILFRADEFGRPIKDELTLVAGGCSDLFKELKRKWFFYGLWCGLLLSILVAIAALVRV